MEKYSVSTNKKRRHKVDRFSSLPDSLLVHILSFLPIKKAVATSLLSKRWRRLWRSLTTLDFNRGNFKNFRSFCKFVDQVLKIVDLKSVRKFVLEFNFYRTPEKTIKWINAVMTSSRVEHVELQLTCFKLPSSVLFANTIRVLKLRELTVDILSYVNLPLLQVLHLRGVRFPVLASLEMLLNSCPLLKDLAIGIPCWLCYRSSLNIGRLEHLVTAQVPPYLIPLDALSNATCLRFVNREDVWPFSNYDIPMFSNVIHLECVALEWTKMVNCLQNFPKLQELVIYKLGSSSSPPEPILDVPPCVSLHLKEFTLLCFRGSENECEMINFMMKNAQVLRAVYVCAGSSQYRLPGFKKLAASLRSGSESCIQMHQQPLVFMIS